MKCKNVPNVGTGANGSERHAEGPICRYHTGTINIRDSRWRSWSSPGSHRSRPTEPAPEARMKTVPVGPTMAEPEGNNFTFGDPLPGSLSPSFAPCAV